MRDKAGASAFHEGQKRIYAEMVIAVIAERRIGISST